MEQEKTKINEDFDVFEESDSENYESVGSLKILKGIGILAGIGGAALGIYALTKKMKKEKPIDVEYEEEDCFEDSEEFDVVSEEQVSEPEEESE